MLLPLWNCGAEERPHTHPHNSAVLKKNQIALFSNNKGKSVKLANMAFNTVYGQPHILLPFLGSRLTAKLKQ